MQWGTLDFHRRSLQNLQEAMRRTRKLCATMVCGLQHPQPWTAGHACCIRNCDDECPPAQCTTGLSGAQVDTVGREITVNREVQIDERGWPKHEGQPFEVKKGDKVACCPTARAMPQDMAGDSAAVQITFCSAANAQADQDAGVLPISYPKFASMVQKVRKSGSANISWILPCSWGEVMPVSQGDTIFLGRYLSTGSEDSSTYLTVRLLSSHSLRRRHACTASGRHNWEPACRWSTASGSASGPALLAGKAGVRCLTHAALRWRRFRTATSSAGLARQPCWMAC